MNKLHPYHIIHCEILRKLINSYAHASLTRILLFLLTLLSTNRVALVMWMMWWNKQTSCGSVTTVVSVVRKPQPGTYQHPLHRHSLFSVVFFCPIRPTATHQTHIIGSKRKWCLFMFCIICRERKQCPIHDPLQLCWMLCVYYLCANIFIYVHCTYNFTFHFTLHMNA